MAEDEEADSGESAVAAELRDNSPGRLLTLSDGIFAIAMTLLTLDLTVPAVGNHPVLIRDTLLLLLIVPLRAVVEREIVPRVRRGR